MERPYKNTNPTDEVTLFTGIEIEHTAAHGKKTLFVVGIYPVETLRLAAHQNKVDHIYLGANHSYNESRAYDPEWENMIKGVLDLGHWVTLDFDVKHVDEVNEMMLNEYNRFIPMISVKIPHINSLNYNACIKLDDVDFDSTNPGVWVHSLHDLQKRGVFTDWSKYTNDDVIE